MIRGNYIIFLEKYSKYLNVVHVQPHRGMKKVILRFEQMYPEVCSVCFVNHFSDNDINILQLPECFLNMQAGVPGAVLE